MADQIAISLETLTVNEGSQLPGVVNFRSRATGTGSVPTTAEYKVYDYERETVITDWTSLGTPAARMTFTLDKDDTRLDDALTKRSFSRVLLIAADRGLATQVVEQRRFRVQPLPDLNTNG